MIIADESANPEFTAAALLAQAEHGSGKEKVYFLFSDQKTFTDTEKQIHKQIGSLAHKTAIEHVLKFGFFGIHVPEFEKIPEVANFIAPEHLEIQVSETKRKFLTRKYYHCRSFVTWTLHSDCFRRLFGWSESCFTHWPFCPFSSGLRVDDFLRRSSFIRYNKSSLMEAEPQINCFAEMENLDGHGSSVNIRSSLWRLRILILSHSLTFQFL